MPQPAFEIFEVDAVVAGGQAVRVPPRPDFSFPLAEVAGAITDRTEARLDPLIVRLQRELFVVGAELEDNGIVGRDHGKASRDREHAERDDERREAQIGDQRAIHHTAQERGGDAGQSTHRE